VFRSSRFTAWTKRDASVMAFAKKIKEKYGTPTPGSTVMILYGDWATQGAGHPARRSQLRWRTGRQTNLKHQAPTPGIGLRRLLHAYDGITTMTVNEYFTSSYCPNCQGCVSEARGSHGLLKCETPSGLCGSYWSRDVLGASNILNKGLHLLSNKSVHPLFGG